MYGKRILNLVTKHFKERPSELHPISYLGRLSFKIILGDLIGISLDCMKQASLYAQGELSLRLVSRE